MTTFEMELYGVLMRDLSLGENINIQTKGPWQWYIEDIFQVSNDNNDSSFVNNNTFLQAVN